LGCLALPLGVLSFLLLGLGVSFEVSVETLSSAFEPLVFPFVDFFAGDAFSCFISISFSLSFSDFSDFVSLSCCFDFLLVDFSLGIVSSSLISTSL